MIENQQDILQSLSELNSLIDTHFYNIEAGLQIIMYIAVAFLLWKVITILYRLFGGVFLGGV